MQLIVQTVDGTARRTGKIWLTAGQSASVGRTEQADYAFPSDALLSAVHFVLQCGQREATVLSRGAGGIWVNGTNMPAAVLHDGDVIQAGATRFQVSVEGALASLESGVDVGDGALGSGTAPSSGAANGGLEVVEQRCPSGAYLYRLAGGLRAASAIAERLKEQSPLHLVTMPQDARHAGAEAPPPSRSAVPLFNWLPERVTAVSPVVLEGADVAAFRRIAGTPEAIDSLACIFSALTGAALLDHLRAAARGRCGNSGPAEPEHMLVAFSPGDLEHRLARCARDFHEFFFSHVDALLFESELDGAWVMLTGREMRQMVADAESIRSIAAA
jgi:hypothetical protein